jgi:hypothetical protein
MLAAIVPFGGQAWFFKMAGPADVIGKQEANFDAFLKSLSAKSGGGGAAAAGGLPAGHPPTTAAAAGAAGGAGGAELPAGHPPLNGGGGAGAAGGAELPAGHPPLNGGAGAAAPGAPAANQAASMKLAKYTTPEGWAEIKEQKPFRVMAFQVGPADQNAEMVITKLASGSGSLLDNVNRWRNQIGLPPVNDAKGVPMQDVSVGKENPGMMMEFHNPDAKKRMEVVVTSAGPELWFLKLTGPADLVAQQKANFESFLKSIEFAPAQ